MSTHRPSAGSANSPTSRSHTGDLSWTDDLPVCHLSGVGFSTNQTYREDGFRCEDHEFEDKSIHFNAEGNVSLYGVFDGHDGCRVPAFAAQRMPAELLLGQLDNRTDDDEINELLLQAFISVDKGFTESIDDLLAEKARLMLHVPEGLQQYEYKYADLLNHVKQIETEIAGGTTAVIALIKEYKLYIANVGCSRALLCTVDQEGVLRVKQVSDDHDIHNSLELERLVSIGTNVDALLNSGFVGDSNNTYTRTIGDHGIKTTIRTTEPFRNVTSDPLIAEPFVNGGIPISDRGFLILMSYGLYKSLRDATGTERVNCDIASMVAAEFYAQSTLNGVAQAVVDRVVRLHHDKFMTSTGQVKLSCQKRKDITLLVRNFNYPLPNAISSPVCGNITNIPLGTPSGVSQTSQLNEPLHVIIPPTSREPPQAPQSLQLFMTNNTNSYTHIKPTNNTTQSSNDSTQSGEDSVRLFQHKSHNLVNNSNMEFDSNGLVGSYVDFSDFYKAIAELTEAQRDAFNSKSEPKPAYETIPEEPTTPQTETIDLNLGQIASAT